MVKWAGPHPVFIESASGAHFTDVDGNDYIDLCLGDTGAMTGHSPVPTVEAVGRQIARGITTMLPTEDAIVVAEELQLDIERIRITATNTSKVPNTSATAASSGSDLNGMAAQAAAALARIPEVDVMVEQEAAVRT